MDTHALRQFDVVGLKNVNDVPTDPTTEAALSVMESNWIRPDKKACRSMSDVMFVGEVKTSSSEKPQAERQILSAFRELNAVFGTLDLYAFIITGDLLHVYKSTSSGLYVTPKIYYELNPAYLPHLLNRLTTDITPHRFLSLPPPNPESISSSQSTLSQIIKLPADCRRVFAADETCNESIQFRFKKSVAKDSAFLGRRTNVCQVDIEEDGETHTGVLKISSIDCATKGNEVQIYRAIGATPKEKKLYLAEAIAIWQGQPSYGIDLKGMAPPPQATSRLFTAILLKELYQPLKSVTFPVDLIKVGLHVAKGESLL